VEDGEDRFPVRLLVEALFSVNTAFAALSIAFGASLSTALPFIHLEVYLNSLLGIPQTDYIRGYLTIWIPSMIVTVCLLTLLRLLRELHVTQLVVRSIAGFMILLSPAAVWTCGYEQNGWSLQWPYKMIWGEGAAAAICIYVFLKGPWDISRRVGVLALLGHSIFWYWFTSDGFHWPIRFEWGRPGYGGVFGMLVGIPALMTWGLYAYRMKAYALGVGAAIPTRSKIV